MKRLLASLTVILFAGCGFQPLHQIRSNQCANNFDIKLKKGEGYTAHRLVTALRRNLTLCGHPNIRYAVHLSVNEGSASLVYSPDGTASRTQVTISADYDLINIKTYQSIYKNSWQLSNSYTVNQTEEFANLTTKQAATDNVIDMMAMDIARDIQAYLKSQS